MAIILAINTITVYATLYTPVHSQTGSCTSPSFQTTFESIHAAEVSGADIHDLMIQYDILLNQPPAQSANGFQQLCIQASQLQANAITNRNTRNLTIALVVPLLSVVLAVAASVILLVARRVRKDRLSDMRILRN